MAVIKYAVMMLGVAQLALCYPTLTLEDLEVADDTMSVGSYTREVRAAPPENYHRSYENDGDGEIGYSRKKSGGGKKGYQHFDTFHKKAGDNYEFEKQDSFGHDEGDDHQGSHSEAKEKKAPKYQEAPPEAAEYGHEQPDESGGASEGGNEAGEGEASEGEASEGGAEPEKSSDIVEAVGHDPADYTLPAKYEYGAGDEYNF